MWPLVPPTKEVNSVLSICISNIADPTRKENFENIEPLLTAAATNFVEAAQTNTLHEFPSSHRVGEVSAEEMIWLYDKKMADARSPGRPIYDELRLAAPFDRCPLCGRGTVYTLDHHLPKSTYPDLSITPVNLVPSCQDCNKNKTHIAPTTATEETLHPYFDNIEDQIWLRARVLEMSPPAIFFFVESPTSWSAITSLRVRNHFRIYRLKKMYASVAAEEISNISGFLFDLYEKSDSEGVREHLQGIALSYRSNRLNTWQAAAYSAMAESDWFCNGGFALDG